MRIFLRGFFGFYFLLLLSFFNLSSCSTKTSRENKYDQISPISEKQMIKIFRDYHLTDAVNSVQSLKSSLSFNERDTLKILDSVIVFHGFTRSEFDSVLVIYTKDLEYYAYIYEQVKIELQKMEDELKVPIKQ